MIVRVGKRQRTDSIREGGLILGKKYKKLKRKMKIKKISKSLIFEIKII